MSLIGLFKGRRGESGHGYASSAEEVTEGIDLSGKRVLITGINSGLGAETARVLSMRGAHIVGAARTVEKAQAALDEIEGESTPVACELSDLLSVKECAAHVADTGKPLDVIICNAGIMAVAKLETIHGIERQFFTNHIGHFTLVTGLLESLADSARVVMLSSAGHQLTPKGGIALDNLTGERGYNKWRNYGQSKLANLLFAVELARRFEGTDKTANAVHPGVIRTNLGRHMGGALSFLFAATGPIYAKTVAQGAATSCYVAAHPRTATISGKYFADCNVAKSSGHGRDAELARKLWDASEEIVERVLSESTQAA